MRGQRSPARVSSAHEARPLALSATAVRAGPRDRRRLARRPRSRAARARSPESRGYLTTARWRERESLALAAATAAPALAAAATAAVAAALLVLAADDDGDTVGVRGGAARVAGGECGVKVSHGSTLTPPLRGGEFSGVRLRRQLPRGLVAAVAFCDHAASKAHPHIAAISREQLPRAVERRALGCARAARKPIAVAASRLDDEEADGMVVATRTSSRRGRSVGRSADRYHLVTAVERGRARTGFCQRVHRVAFVRQVPSRSARVSARDVVAGPLVGLGAIAISGSRSARCGPRRAAGTSTWRT